MSHTFELKGEAIAMMEQIAQRAAEKAAEKVSEQTRREIRIDILEMESRLKAAFEEEVERKIRVGLNMSAADHAIEHSEIRQVLSMGKSIKTEVWKRVGTAILIGGLAFAAGTGAESVKETISEEVAK